MNQLEIIFNEMDCKLFLGEDLPDGYFNDDNGGRVLKLICWVINEYFTSFLWQRIPSIFLVYLSPFQGVLPGFLSV